MNIERITSLEQVSAAEWNRLTDDNPTVQHEFLLALERNHCAVPATGWSARHLLLRNDKGELIGALPLYLKPHSWGEFVFDFSWASAYQRYGRSYYPKLVSAIPFTPATGSRLLARTHPSVTKREIQERLIAEAREMVEKESLSSLHVLFTEPEEQTLLEAHGFIGRCDCQFHWRNKNFGSFDEFIATFRAGKRKKALRERRRIAEAGVRFETVRGCDMSAAQWNTTMQLSEATFHSHGHEHYLNVEFFQEIARALPDSIVVKLALHDAAIVAAAIFYKSASTLYGRYWGASAHINGLHFETCYYQGIDYCIEQGLQYFEPGTQGEHKIARGFAPTKTHSAHYIADAPFAHAIRQHAAEERKAIDRYIVAVNEHLPFHRDLS